MVGQRLQKYIADFGLEPRDVPTVITTFLGAKYVTLCVFIGPLALAPQAAKVLRQRRPWSRRESHGGFRAGF